MIDIKIQEWSSKRLPASAHTHPLKHPFLCSYKSPVAEQQSTPPEPVEVEGTLEYEVNKVIDSCLKHGKLEYLVKWSGYTDDFNTWELLDNLSNSKEAVEACHNLNPSAPWKIYASVFQGLIFKYFKNFCEPSSGTVSWLEVKE